jgi:hypothetical protein
VTSPPFNGPDDLIAQTQAGMRDATLRELETWAAERTHVFAGHGYRTVRAQAARAEIARRGLTQLCEYDDEAILRAVEAELALPIHRGLVHRDLVAAIVGGVMRRMRGRANPAQVVEVAKAVIEGVPDGADR